MQQAAQEGPAVAVDPAAAADLAERVDPAAATVVAGMAAAGPAVRTGREEIINSGTYIVQLHKSHQRLTHPCRFKLACFCKDGQKTFDLTAVF